MTLMFRSVTATTEHKQNPMNVRRRECVDETNHKGCYASQEEKIHAKSRYKDLEFHPLSLSCIKRQPPEKQSRRVKRDQDEHTQDLKTFHKH